MAKGDIIVEANNYISEYEGTLTEEVLFTQFKRVSLVREKFNRYLKESNIDLDKLEKTLPKKSSKYLEKRRLFINWYMESNPDKTHNDCVKDLANLLFVSENTIRWTYYGYR